MKEQEFFQNQNRVRTGSGGYEMINWFIETDPVQQNRTFIRTMCRQNQQVNRVRTCHQNPVRSRCAATGAGSGSGSAEGYRGWEPSCLLDQNRQGSVQNCPIRPLNEGLGPAAEPGPAGTSGLWLSITRPPLLLSVTFMHPSAQTHRTEPSRTLTGRVDRSRSRHVSSPKQRLRTRIGSDGADAQEPLNPAVRPSSGSVQTHTPLPGPARNQIVL